MHKSTTLFNLSTSHVFRLSSFVLFLTFFVFLSTSFVNAQESKVTKIDSIQTINSNLPNTPQAEEGDVKITDGTNTLIRITDEGTFGAIEILPGTPDDSDNKLYNKNGILSFDGSPVASSGDNDWGISGNNMHSTPSGNIGIGTASPTAKLHVNSNDGVLFTGNFGDGTFIPPSGIGTRMMWYSQKAAFRTGRLTGISGAFWNADSIGSYSTAMGYNTRAKGDFSLAVGYHSNASGVYSTAMGSETTSSDEAATAMGIGTTASGEAATAMGYYTRAIAFASTSMGEETIASGDGATAMGTSTVASGSNSTAMGSLTTASGINSTALGSNTKAESFNATAIGSNNIGGGAVSTWVGTDPLFEIGNGELTASNAMTVLKNGNVGIGSNTPTRELEIVGTAKMDNLIVGTSGVSISSIVKLQGRVDNSGFQVSLDYPEGFNRINTFVLACKVYSDDNTWHTAGRFNEADYSNTDDHRGLYTSLGNKIYIYLPSYLFYNTYKNNDYKIVIMRID